MRCPVQGGRAVRLGAVHIRLLCDQRPHGVVVLRPGGVDQTLTALGGGKWGEGRQQ